MPRTNYRPERSFERYSRTSLYPSTGMVRKAAIQKAYEDGYLQGFLAGNVPRGQPITDTFTDVEIEQGMALDYMVIDEVTQNE